jgi:Tannase-like family of unknown function (DUF6351)
VGGYDIDLNPTPARAAADPAALQAVYLGGGVNEGNNLATVPMIDLRGHDTEEIHEDYRSYAMRDRLDAFNGGHGNQVIWTGPIALEGFEGSQSMAQAGFLEMDRWLSNIHNDHSAAPLAQKVLTDKPQGLQDTCYDATGDPIPDQSTCPTLYPYYANPRIAAGEPAADDVIKCQLQPLNRNAYGAVAFSDAQWSELQAAFPNGVCNYGAPGVNQGRNATWVSYAAGPGGVPLGAAPASQPLGPQAEVPETLWPGLLVATALVVALAGVRRSSRRVRTQHGGRS